MNPASAVMGDIIEQQGVFIVTGECGEYSDHTMWISCVATSLDSALAFLQACREWALQCTGLEDDDERPPCPDPRVPSWRSASGIEWNVHQFQTTCAIPGIYLPAGSLGWVPVHPVHGAYLGWIRAPSEGLPTDRIMASIADAYYRTDSARLPTAVWSSEPPPVSDTREFRVHVNSEPRAYLGGRGLTQSIIDECTWHPVLLPEVPDAGDIVRALLERGIIESSPWVTP